MAPILGNPIAWLLGLIVGGVALFAAGQLVHGDHGDLSHGLWTALAGTVVWAVLSWIPLVGILLAPIGWIAVINLRYPGDWGDAITTAVVAWLIALAGLFVLSVIGVDGFGVVGIPLV